MDDYSPRSLVDKLGCPFEIVRYGAGELDDIARMYDSFIPEAIAQGLPPSNRDARIKWIEGLLETGINLVALQDNRVTGHCALIPDRTITDGEYLIFVGGPYRKRGFATELTRGAVSEGRRMGLRTVWLTVEANNFRAIKLYRKIGFVFRDKGMLERKMELEI